LPKAFGRVRLPVRIRNSFINLLDMLFQVEFLHSATENMPALVNNKGNPVENLKKQLPSEIIPWKTSSGINVNRTTQMMSIKDKKRRKKESCR